MGNCQAIDAAALVIQHPTGKIERFYCPIPASEVMRLNPGHYVSLIIPLPPPPPPAAIAAVAVSGDQYNNQNDKKGVQFTRVKLLRPSDNLALGHAYRLVTTQEVMKVLRAKKYAKMNKQQPESLDKQNSDWPENKPERDKDEEKDHQATKHEGNTTRTPPISSNALRSKSWRPTLQSISEAAS